MKKSMLMGVGFLAVSAMVPGRSEAQATGEREGTQAGADTTAAQPAVSRATELERQIAAVQQRARQDPAVAADYRAIMELIAATARRQDPAYSGYEARAVTLKTDVAAARAAQDNAKLWQLADEAKQLQANIAAAQAKAKEDPAVKERLEQYKVKLFAKMVELEPKVQALVNELNSLQSGGTSGGGARP